MRCPKCGAFLEEGKTSCYMCGVDFNKMNSSSNNSEFGGASSTNGFNPNLNSDYLKKKEEYNNRFNDYKNVKFDASVNQDKDIFDIFAQYGKIIKIGLVVFSLIIISIVLYKYSQNKSEFKPVEPVIGSLYYKVNDDFIAVSNQNNVFVYNRTGEKGSDCSITIQYSAGTSEDHVKELFSAVKKNHAPVRDKNNNIAVELNDYSSQESSLSINNSTWYYINLFYRKDLNSEFTQLRYKYLTAVYQGYYYDVALVNNGNDLTCSSSLDNFAKSLTFVK